MEQLETGGAEAKGGRDDEWVGSRMVSWPFGQTVGEMQGESQHPPESLRVGRKCTLAPYQIHDGGQYDEVAQVYVHYWNERIKTLDEQMDEVVARIMGLWVKHYDEESPLFEGYEEEIEHALSRVD